MSPYKSGTKRRACSADSVSEFTSHEQIFMVKGGGGVKGSGCAMNLELNPLRS